MPSEMLLIDMQARAEVRGEPAPSCYHCEHFRQRTDSGRTHVGRCVVRDEEQFEFGACQSYELHPLKKEDIF